ncbi:hypothetical protein AAG570_007733 [Ranatra chinensis]|uniref:Uncharacterized protein n=1 Tax=Ranatra chinensis TaxID=642074 RepID=A0ABD0XUI3_9HEMI
MEGHRIGLSNSQAILVASLPGAVVLTKHPFLVLRVILPVASSLPPLPEFMATLKTFVLADPSFNSTVRPHGYLLVETLCRSNLPLSSVLPWISSSRRTRLVQHIGRAAVRFRLSPRCAGHRSTAVVSVSCPFVLPTWWRFFADGGEYVRVLRRLLTSQTPAVPRNRWPPTTGRRVSPRHPESQCSLGRWFCSKMSTHVAGQSSDGSQAKENSGVSYAGAVLNFKTVDSNKENIDSVGPSTESPGVQQSKSKSGTPRPQTEEFPSIGAASNRALPPVPTNIEPSTTASTPPSTPAAVQKEFKRPEEAVEKKHYVEAPLPKINPWTFNKAAPPSEKRVLQPHQQDTVGKSMFLMLDTLYFPIHDIGSDPA